jgi:acyl carrier protein
MSDESTSEAAPEAVERRCIAIIAKSKLIPEESVTRASTFDELQIDSLDKINISFEIEDVFRIQIPDDSISGLKTVGDVVDGVIRLQHEAAAPAAAATPQPAGARTN